MLGFLRLDHVYFLAGPQVDQSELFLLLDSLHQAQVQLVFTVGLSLHIDGVAAQQVTDSCHATLDTLLDLVTI